jgi:hypothetical protein
MPIALPPPDDGEEQQPAAVMDIVAVPVPQTVESVRTLSGLAPPISSA